ncbi:hypothetical protein BDV19DRAFT_395358 [Aspergillus venezuelensis]
MPSATEDRPTSPPVQHQISPQTEDQQEAYPPPPMPSPPGESASSQRDPRNVRALSRWARNRPPYQAYTPPLSNGDETAYRPHDKTALLPTSPNVDLTNTVGFAYLEQLEDSGISLQEAKPPGPTPSPTEPSKP